MRQLREFSKGLKVTTFLLLAIATASTATLMTPRPANAEGPLLGTVRCLVQTLLLTDCSRQQTPAPAPTQPAPSSPSTAQPAQAPQQTAPAQQQTPVAPIPQDEAIDAQLEMPLEVVSEQVSTTKPIFSSVGTNTIQRSEYVAYFNKYSPYAVLGAQQQSEASMPFSQSSEGWKIFGIPWYFLGIIFAPLLLILPSVRRPLLRKFSVLLNK